MKSNLLTGFFLMAFFLLACKKEEAPEPRQPEAEKFSVTFKVKNIEQYIEDLPDKLTEDLGQEDNYINYVDFFIYDGEGELVRISQQEDWAADFPPEFEFLYGEMHVHLEPGDYKLVVFGTEKDQNYIDSVNYSTAFLTLEYYENEIGDIFYKEVPFTVTGAEIIDTVHLDRIAGQVEFRLTETLDPIVKYMDFYLQAVRGFPFDPENTPEIGWTYAELIRGGFEPYHTYDYLWRVTILPGRTAKFDVTPILTIHGPKAFYIEQRHYKGVYVYPNKKTVVKGSLWDREPLQNFYIDADSTYGEPVQIDLDDLEFNY